VRQRSQDGRAPANNSSLPPSAAANRARTNRGSAGFDQYDNHHQPVQPRNSFGNSSTQNSYQSKVTGLRSRPSSIHSSPGSSRPGSPQTVIQPGSKTQPPPQQQQQQRRPISTRNSPATGAQGNQFLLFSLKILFWWF